MAMGKLSCSNPKQGWKVEVERELPASLGDKLWHKLVAGGGETVTVSFPKDMAARIHQLALGNWVIAAQAYSRSARSRAEAANRLKAYVYGARMEIVHEVKVVDLAQLASVGITFTAEQVAELLKTGVKVVNIPEEIGKKLVNHR